MAMTKQTDDTRRVTTTILDNRLCPVAFTVTCRVNMANIADVSLQTLLDLIVQGTRGWTLWFINANTLQFARKRVGSATQTTHSLTHSAPSGWTFVLASVDDAGNSRVRLNDEATTVASGLVTEVTGNVRPLNILTQWNGNNGPITPTLIADIRVYDYQLSLNEELALMHGQGRGAPRKPPILWLPCVDSPPGTDTDAVVPRDVADPSRLFQMSGAGDAFLWTESPYPLRSPT